MRIFNIKKGLNIKNYKFTLYIHSPFFCKQLYITIKNDLNDILRIFITYSYNDVTYFLYNITIFYTTIFFICT